MAASPEAAVRGARQFLLIDEPTLRAVAEIDRRHLLPRRGRRPAAWRLLRTCRSQIELQTEDREISVVFAIVGALLAAAAVGLSLLWNRYP